MTDSFLSLSQKDRGCQNEETYNNCTTRAYLEDLKKRCKCLPLSLIIDFEKVFSVSEKNYVSLIHFRAARSLGSLEFGKSLCPLFTVLNYLIIKLCHHSFIHLSIHLFIWQFILLGYIITLIDLLCIRCLVLFV